MRASNAGLGETTECTDITARKVHQYAVVATAVLGLVIGGPLGVLLLVFDGAVMAIGRFWWPADVFRQAVWRFAQPRGWFAARSIAEDRETRRVARVFGGGWLVVMALALALGSPLLAVILALPLLAMILADATFDFCALCLVRYQARMLRFRLTHR